MVTLEYNSKLTFMHSVWLTASQKERYIIIYLDKSTKHAQSLFTYPAIIIPDAPRTRIQKCCLPYG